jgi:hypothetical protein
VNVKGRRRQLPCDSTVRDETNDGADELLIEDQARADVLPAKLISFISRGDRASEARLVDHNHAAFNLFVHDYLWPANVTAAECTPPPRVILISGNASAAAGTATQVFSETDETPAVPAPAINRALPSSSRLYQASELQPTGTSRLSAVQPPTRIVGLSIGLLVSVTCLRAMVALPAEFNVVLIRFFRESEKVRRPCE